MKVTLNDYLGRAEQSFYSYEGSLTTPECNEIVNWVILREIQPCNKEQFEIFEKKLDKNFRYIQNLNTRTIYVTEADNNADKPRTTPYAMIFLGGISIVLILALVYYIKKRRTILVDTSEANQRLI